MKQKVVTSFYPVTSAIDMENVIKPILEKGWVIKQISTAFSDSKKIVQKIENNEYHEPKLAITLLLEKED